MILTSAVCQNTLASQTTDDRRTDRQHIMATVELAIQMCMVDLTPRPLANLMTLDKKLITRNSVSMVHIVTIWHRADQSRILATPLYIHTHVPRLPNLIRHCSWRAGVSIKVCQVNSAWSSIGGKAQMNQWHSWTRVARERHSVSYPVWL